ncbi:MAG: UDP-2,3-diacylglucosamine diphosphatase LpxI [Pyrinomonadaceae bacterium]|nr:UDP-2,3-diacylglucosamine diphosphatase LpxI [Pyrinomonadaceae bacterium]
MSKKQTGDGSSSSLIPPPSSLTALRYGLIAGNGKFPFLVVEGARRAGVSLAVAAIREETDPKIEQAVAAASGSVVWIGIGQLGKMIRFFKREGVRQAIMAGQVRHVQIFSGALPDVRMLKLLLSLPRRNTDALIGGVAKELAGEGIELIDSTYFLPDHLPAAGTLTRRAPDKREEGDIEYGLAVAREIARLDLGQTIVVRARACVAIEAMEGTDAAVRRAGELARGRLTVVKVAKPDQDMRFDVPVVGVPTVETMIAAGATCLCLTAGKTLIFDREEMLRLADQNKISVVAVSPG